MVDQPDRAEMAPAPEVITPSVGQPVAAGMVNNHAADAAEDLPQYAANAGQRGQGYSPSHSTALGLPTFGPMRLGRGGRLDHLGVDDHFLPPFTREVAHQQWHQNFVTAEFPLAGGPIQRQSTPRLALSFGGDWAPWDPPIWGMTPRRSRLDRGLGTHTQTHPQ